MSINTNRNSIEQYDKLLAKVLRDERESEDMSVLCEICSIIPEDQDFSKISVCQLDKVINLIEQESKKLFDSSEAYNSKMLF